MQRGVFFSSVLHLAVLGLAYFHLWDLIFPPQPLEDTPIAVELINIAPETRATRPNQTPPKPQAKPEDETVEAQLAPKQPPKPIPPPPAPPPSAAPPPPPPPQLAQAQPEPPKAEPKPEQPPAPPPPPAPAPTPKAPPPDPPKPTPPPPPPPKPMPPPDPNKKKQDELAFDALLKNLSKRSESQKSEAPPKPTQQPQQQAKASSQPVAPLGPQLTTSEIDVVKQQIEHCWSPSAAAKEAHDLIVDITAEVAEDGRVVSAQITSTARMGDPFYRAAAESALRAVLNPQCSPLKLPPEKYQQWKILNLTFNPKDLL